MTGAKYVPLNPARILDTRDNTGGLGGPSTSHAARPFAVSGQGGVPWDCDGRDRQPDRDGSDQQRVSVHRAGRDERPDEFDPQLPSR